MGYNSGLDRATVTDAGTEKNHNFINQYIVLLKKENVYIYMELLLFCYYFIHYYKNMLRLLNKKIVRLNVSKLFLCAKQLLNIYF